MAAAVAQLHAAHDIGIDETSRQESDERGSGNARSQTENGMKSGVVGPVGRAGNGITNRAHRHKEEVHQKACPNEQSRFLIAPHLAHAVVDDVGDGEDD